MSKIHLLVVIVWLLTSHTAAAARTGIDGLALDPEMRLREAADPGSIPTVGTVGALIQRESNPLSLSAADFDADGVPDLVVAYAVPTGGAIAIFPGNPRLPWAIDRRDARLQEKFTESFDPFFVPRDVVGTSKPPVFLEAGDFNGDHQADLIFTTEGSRELWMLPGNGRLGFGEAEGMAELPGEILFLSSAHFGRLDSAKEIAIGWSSESSSGVRIYRSGSAARSGGGVFSYQDLDLPAAPVAAEFGFLDQDALQDLVVTTLDGMFLFYSRSDSFSGRRAWLSLGSTAFAVAVGDFASSAGEEIALLRSPGVLEVWRRERGESRGWISDQFDVGWEGTLGFSGPSRSVSLIPAKVTTASRKDLVLLDTENERLGIVSFGTDERGGVRVSSSTWSLPSGVSAMLPMSLNRDAFSDLVFATSDRVALQVWPSQSTKVFIVNDAGDASDADLQDGKCDVDLEAEDLQCTLRSAIWEAARSDGPDTILFEVSHIRPTEILGGFDSVTIDGRVLSGGEPSEMKLFLDGSGYPSGTYGSLVGIKLQYNNSVSNVVVGNFLGGGISMTGGGNIIQGNVVGTDSFYSADLGSFRYGIVVREQDNLVGGTVPEAANVVGNYSVGILLDRDRPETDRNQILGNYVGTDPSGTIDLRNSTGIEMVGASTNFIGGLLPGESNRIQFNGTGVRMRSSAAGKSSDFNYLAGNLITENTVGVEVYEGNIGNTISRNRIFLNSRWGIDLGSCFFGSGPLCGPTPNDDGDPEADPPVPPDADEGPNGLQNYPVLTQSAGALQIELVSTPSSSFEVELFSNETCDESGFGEGQAYWTSVQLETDQEGYASRTVGGAPPGFITATATELVPLNDPEQPGATAPGSTSEFSACAAVASPIFVVNTIGDDPDEDAADGSWDGICSTGKKRDGSQGACNPSVENDCECTLRAAIQEANGREGKDQIHFQIETESTDGVGVIRPGEPLPRIQDSVQVDGYTQEGSREASTDLAALLKVEIDGSQAGEEADGFYVSASDSEIRGLAVHSFSRHGIVLESDDNVIAGNHLGTDGTGTSLKQDPLSSLTGVWVLGSSRNRIGGGEPRDRNLISGAVAGIQVFAQTARNNEIHGNWICTDSTGAQPITEQMCAATGIFIRGSSENQIGGSQPNRITGTLFGIAVQGGEKAVGNRIQGNLIGTSSSDVLDDSALGNWIGIGVRGHQTLIGGSESSHGNIIARTADFEPSSSLEDQPSTGILLLEEARDTFIWGNTIAAFAGPGIHITRDASHNQIGGGDPALANVIRENGVGVRVDEQATANQILSNSIVDNGALGIDLGSPGILANDRNDLDEGPNELQNTPVFREVSRQPFVTVDSSQITIRARLDSTPDEDFEIQFFGAYEPVGYSVCEGERYLGSRTIPTNSVGNGYALFRFPRSQFEGLNLVTATATNLRGNTSEFARCAVLVADSDGDGVPDVMEDEGANGGDSNENGVADSLEPNVTAIPSYAGYGESVSPSIGVETTAAQLILDTLFEPGEAFETYIIVSRKNQMPFSWSQSRQILNGTSDLLRRGLPLGAQQVGAGSVMTYRLPAGSKVDSFYNYGPTPDQPVDHLYEFLYDGETGAKILADRIEVHFVDGARGDHDLTVNGVIETLGGPVVESTTFFFPHLADGSVGDIRFQSSLILGNPGSLSPIQIDLADTTGDFLSLELDELGTDSYFEFGLRSKESFSVQTPGLDSLRVGYAKVRAGVSTGGTAVFSRSHAPTGTLLYEAGVPASSALTDFSIFVDSLGNRNTGLAIAYPKTGDSGQVEAQLILRLYEVDSTPVDSRNLTLQPGEHLARFISELFPAFAERASEMQGVVTVESDQPISAVTLRQNDDPALNFPEEVPTLTAFPVIEGRPAERGPAPAQETVFYFPQVGNGEVGNIRFQTSLIFVNTGEATELTLEFFDSKGTPMRIDLGFGSSDSALQKMMAEGEAFVVTTEGSGALQVGYARVTTSNQVGGTAVFARTDRATGVLLYEAGVPTSKPLQEFGLVVDTRGDRNTGVALVRTDESATGPATVTLRLRWKEGELLAETSLRLSGGEHWARYVTEIFPEVDSIDEMEGSVEISSPVPLAAITLRQNDHPVLEFPAEVPTLTIFPVLER